MAFRKRNVAIGRAPDVAEVSVDATASQPQRGVRPSTLTSHPVTSTGASSLDGLLGGHNGLALGSSLLIEESGTTDFAGALLRYYAAEGVCHGHVVHVVGMPDNWTSGLPAVVDERASTSKNPPAESEKMKIAWRYERLGQAGERALPSRPHLVSSSTEPGPLETTFCHTFDLAKRLQLPQDARFNFIRIAPSSTPFEAIIHSIEQSVKITAPHTPHRIVIPTILSPALYHPHATHPQTFLRFLHSLRALLRRYSTQLTAMTTFPLELFPRDSALVRSAENLSDGVLELTPFPHLMDASNALAESGGARGNDEQPQGLVRVHRIPITSERGEGGAGVGNSLGEDLAFTISRRKFVIKPFSLPPMEGDQEAQQEAGKLTGKDIEF